MPKKVEVEHDAESLKHVVSTLKFVASGLEVVAETMKTEGITTVLCTNHTELERGLRGIEGFLASARKALLTSTQSRRHKGG